MACKQLQKMINLASALPGAKKAWDQQSKLEGNCSGANKKRVLLVLVFQNALSVTLFDNNVPTCICLVC